MAQRRNANRIRGPQSALTDFLAANNISAQQIRDSYEQRNQLARQQAAANATTPDAATAQIQEELDEELAELVDDVEAAAPESSKKKRKRPEDKKAKASKKHKKNRKKGSDDDDSDNDYDDAALGRDMYRKAKPNPGQLENCEICEKRFTVTAYSKTGPDGGLVCGPCGRDLVKDANKSADKPKKAATGKGRRKIESNRLDGIVTRGSKSLQQMCIEKVADHHLDVEDLGDMPDAIMKRLSEIFAKRRVIDPRTLRLFIRPDLDAVAIHDCSKLEVEDYNQIFAVVPSVKSLVLRNACQFKDATVEYMLEKATNITDFKVYAANLVSNDMWIQFFTSQGPKLRSLQLEWLDASFTDDVVEAMVTHCTSLRRLKLKYCRQLTARSIPLIARFTSLQHLSLHCSTTVSAPVLSELIVSVGSSLQTLSLENFVEIDDTTIHAIRTNCQNVSKLRLTPLDSVTDDALTSLFGGSRDEPTVLPPLRFLDFNSARDVDNNNPSGPVDAPIGLGSRSFKALMTHSGTTIGRLQFPSCRHVEQTALWDVFIGSSKKSNKPSVSYPELREINCSFVPGVDTSIVVGIFKACPKLKKVVAFGCFRIEDVKVPGGVALIGVPRAQDVIEQFGDAEAVFDDGLLGGFTSTGVGIQAGRPIEIGA